MHRLAVVALALTLPLGACSALPAELRPEETPFEGVPGPGYYTLTIEPDAAIDSRDIVLTVGGDFQVRPRALLGDTDLATTGGADIYAKDGKRLVHQIVLPGTLVASVDGVRCDGIIEQFEDMESDATLTIDAERCSLRLDGRHRVEDVDHRLDSEPMP